MAVKFSNNGKTTLASNITSSATSISVTDGSVFPTLSGGDTFYMTLEDVSGNIEIVSVTARSGNTLTVTRAQESTTARSFSSGDKAENRLTAAGLNSFVSDSGDTMTGNLSLGDNLKTTYGADDDLEIYHSSSDGHSYIHHTKAAVTGFPSVPSDLILKGNNIKIVNEDGDNLLTATSAANGGTKLWHEGSQKLNTTSSGARVSGDLLVTGSIDANEVTLDNSEYIYLGTNDTMYLMTNGSQSYVHSGDQLFIRSNNLQLTNTGSNKYFTGVNGGAATIYYNDSAKLATTSTGIDVTGTVTADGLTVSSGSNQITLDTGDQTTYGRLDVGHFSNGTFIGTYAGTNAAANVLRFGTSGSELARLDASGNFMVGKTSATIANDGFTATAGGYVTITDSSFQPLVLNRKTSNGTILELRKDNTTVGSIGTEGGDIYLGTGDTNLRFHDGSDMIYPAGSSGTSRDNAVDLGHSSGRWKDLYLSGTAYADNASITGNLTLSDSGYSIGNEYHTWKRDYIVNQGNPDELLYRDGNSLPNGGVYRFHAHIAGTGTDQSATAVYWNQDGTWKLNVTYQSGTTSNHPEFIIDGGVPKISIDHASNYTIHVLGERLELSEGTGTDNKSGFGADAYLSVNNTTLRFNPSGAGPIDTGDLIWHAGNDGSGSGLDADLLDGQHGSHYLDYNNFTNTPTIPTNNNQLTNGAGYATETYVDTAVSGLVDSAPSTLDTLNELAAALGDDANFSTTVTNSIATKLPLAGGTLTGDLNINNAALQVGSLTVITSARNMQNIGNINIGGYYAMDNTTVIDTSRNFITNSSLTFDYNDHYFEAGTNSVAFKNASGSVYTKISNTGLDVTGGVDIDSGTATGLTIDHDTFGAALKIVRNHASNAPSITWENTSGRIGILYANDSDNNLKWRPGTGSTDYELWHSGNDGTGSGLDADTVDGIQASSFLRSDANDTFTGTLTTGELQIFSSHPVHTGYSGIANTEAWTTTTSQYMIISAGTETYINGDSVYIRGGNNSTANQFRVTTSGSTIGGNTVWHAGNDGSNSGLDADTLDGLHGYEYHRTENKLNWVRVGHGDSGTAYWHKLAEIVTDGNYHGYLLRCDWTSRYTHGELSMQISSSNNTTAIVEDVHVKVFGETRTKSANHFKYYKSGSTVQVWVYTPAWEEFDYIRRDAVTNGEPDITWYTESTTTQQTSEPSSLTAFTDHTPWTPVNDGSGSGLDADTVDGIQASNFLRSDVADTAAGRITFDDGFVMADGSASVSFTGDTSTNLYLSGNGEYRFRPNGTTTNKIVMSSTNLEAPAFTASGNTVWHAGNDGSSSGLDADTLDGLHASSFTRTTATANLNMSNFNISNVNALIFNDPGPDEGIQWNGGSIWKIYESPDNLSTNSGGNLQFVKNTTRSMTLNTDGDLYVARNITAGGQKYPDFNTTGRFYLGNNDWSELISGTNNGYSATHQGVSFGSVSGAIPCRIPIDPNATYRVSVRVKHISTSSGSGRFYFAVQTLNENFTNLSSDTATSYNYGVASNQSLTAGQVYTFSADFSGYNTTSTGVLTKFDPEGKYFDLYYITNYQGGGETVIQSVEVERISEGYLRGDTFGTSSSGLYLQGGSYNAGTDTVTAPLIIDEGDYIYTKDGGYLRKLIGKASDVIYIGQGGTALITQINFQPGTAGNSAVKVNGNTVWNAGNDGSGSGLDADTLDGYQAEGSSGNRWGIIPAVLSSGVMEIGRYIDFHASDGSTEDYRVRLDGGTSGQLYLSGNKVWHAGNDGSGSGLDADLLDGNHASAFTSSDHFKWRGTSNLTSTTTSALKTELLNRDVFDSSLSAFKTSWSYAGNADLTDAGRFTEMAGTSWLTWTDNSTDNTQGNFTALVIAPNTGGSAGKVFIYNDQGSSYSPGWREVWTSASDGSGSGLDADTLDGVHASGFISSTADDTASGDLTFAGLVTLSGGAIGGYPQLRMTAGSSSTAYIHMGDSSDIDVGGIEYSNAADSMIFKANAAERFRIDSSGQLTARTYQSSSTVPQIGMKVTSSNDAYNTGFNTPSVSLGYGLGMVLGGTAVINMRWGYAGGHFAPAMNYSGSGDAMNLGLSTLRWKQVYAYNTSISSSDESLKSQIASLTDAEITAATAISKLFKTYKWTGKVEEEGDDARTHTGVVAQHVQQALADAGLEPFQYSFLCKDTYWQRTIEHPAVEAVEGQEAVYDENGNIVTEAVEEVLQQYAWKENQTFVEGDDIPEDATEITLLSIRYEELMAFVGAATEQRLTDIETRLAALEG